MASQGHIKIDRRILSWEWYKDSNMVHVFLHLLLNANYTDSRFEGSLIKRGQLVIGRLKLATALGLTERQIRTCLKKLKTTNEIAIKTTNRFSVVTIIKYDDYQSPNKKSDQQDDQKIAQQATSKRPASDQQATTSNKDKEDKEGKEGIREVNVPFDFFWDLYDKKVGDKQKLIKKWESLKNEERELAIQHIPNYKISQPDKKFRKDPQTYLNNKSWNDEIILSLGYVKQQLQVDKSEIEKYKENLERVERLKSQNTN